MDRMFRIRFRNFVGSCDRTSLNGVEVPSR